MKLTCFIPSFAHLAPSAGGTLPTDHRYTGQKADGTGLSSANARTQRVPDDPALGQFVSPDTLVLAASRVGDYN